MHRYIYRENRRIKGIDKLENKAGHDGDIAEEKELVLTDVKVIREDGEETTTAQVESKESNENEETES